MDGRHTAWIAWITTSCALVVCIDSQCPKIDLKHALTNPDCNGLYIDIEIPCNQRYMYRHSTRSLYLYYHNGYWVVYGMPCDASADDVGLMRVASREPYPQNIPDDAEWFEHDGDGGWKVNCDADTSCFLQNYDPDAPHDDDDDKGDEDDGLSAGAIAGICIGMLLFVALIVLITVLLCKQHKKKKNNDRKMQTAPPLELSPYILQTQAIPAALASSPYNVDTEYNPTPDQQRYLDSSKAPANSYSENPFHNHTKGVTATHDPSRSFAILGQTGETFYSEAGDVNGSMYSDYSMSPPVYEDVVTRVKQPMRTL